MNHEVSYKMELAVCGAAGRAQPEGMASTRALRQHRAWQVLGNAQGPCGWSGGSRKEEERSHRDMGPDPGGNCSFLLN